MARDRQQHSNRQEPIAKLGEVLRDFRKDLGLSLRKAAYTAGISPAHLCKIEKGNSFKSLGIHVPLRLCKVYQVSLAAILNMAGFTEKSDDYLPPLEHYLRMKFHLPPQAIRDIEIAKTVVETKYQSVVQAPVVDRNGRKFNSSRQPRQEKASWPR
jgi:transcriptional regulator with XRE-family HTH domain